MVTKEEPVATGPDVASHPVRVKGRLSVEKGARYGHMGVGNTLINDCYDASTLGFGFANDFVHGAIPSGPAGSCVGAETMGDPQFVDSQSGDFHTQNAAAQLFGAYAP